ncbi:DNA ligase 1-like [Dorcoceras hygrometricum]|nr:DNA ligase 1-like [Dorcoceras hygrometricum]
MPDGLAGLGKRSQEAASRSAARNSSGTLAEEKMGYNKDKRVDTRNMDAQGFRNEAGGNSTVQNFTTFGKSKFDGIPRPEEEYIDRKWEDNEKSKEIVDNKQRDKHKEEDNKRFEKEKDRKKKKEEKKNKEKVKIEAESKKTEVEMPRDLAKDDLVGVTSNKGTGFLKDVRNSVITDGNIKKRKDMTTNGFFLENETRPIKMARLTPHQSTENGRKLEASRTPSASASNKHVVSNSVRLDKGERLINGMIEAQKSLSPKPITPSTMMGDQHAMIDTQKLLSSRPIMSSTMIGDQHAMIEAQKSLSSKRITSSTMISDHAEGSKTSLHNSKYSNKAPPEPKMEDPMAEAARRPPHPDSKYLNELLTVPKLVDWSENDDQDWLFSKQLPSTKRKSGSVLVEEQHVWSEAVLIESADVCAMPYVIPY